MPACVVGSLGRVVGEMEQLERFARGRPFPIGMSHRVDRYAIVSTCVLLFFVGWAVPLVAARLIEGRDLIEVLSPP